MKAPEYGITDVFFFAGFLVGLGLAYLALNQFEVEHGLVRVIASIATGSCVGYVFEQAYGQRQSEHDSSR